MLKCRQTQWTYCRQKLTIWRENDHQIGKRSSKGFTGKAPSHTIQVTQRWWQQILCGLWCKGWGEEDIFDSFESFQISTIISLFLWWLLSSFVEILILSWDLSKIYRYWRNWRFVPSSLSCRSSSAWTLPLPFCAQVPVRPESRNQYRSVARREKQSSTVCPTPLLHSALTVRD